MILNIDKLVQRGLGIGYLNSKTVFVPYTLPGDVVRIKISHENKSIAFAEVVEYLARSSDYIEPSCSSFGYPKCCGACDYLHLSYDNQLKIKNSQVKEIFSSFVNPGIIQSVVPSPQQTRYRNKFYLPVAGSGNGLHYGMYKRLSHSVIPHEDCLLQPDFIDPLFRAIIEVCKKANISAYDPQTGSGILRHIGVRTNSDNQELLVILVTKSARLPFSNLLTKSLLDRFRT